MLKTWPRIVLAYVDWGDEDLAIFILMASGVQIAIENLVSENKKLVTEIYAIEVHPSTKGANGRISRF